MNGSLEAPQILSSSLVSYTVAARPLFQPIADRFKALCFIMPGLSSLFRSPWAYLVGATDYLTECCV